MGEALVHATRLDPTTVLVQVRGELDLNTAPALTQVLIDQIDRGGLTELIVDMAHLGFMDSTGIGALVAGYGTAERAGVRFSVRKPSSFVHHQLSITGLAELFSSNNSPTPPA